MRINIKKRYSTKAERVFYEILKKNKILFRFREDINGHEIDFIIGKYAIEIDGHEQSSKRNTWLFKLGYIPLHYSNNAVINEKEKVEQTLISKLKQNGLK